VQPLHLLIFISNLAENIDVCYRAFQNFAIDEEENSTTGNLPKFLTYYNPRNNRIHERYILIQIRRMVRK